MEILKQLYFKWFGVKIYEIEFTSATQDDFPRQTELAWTKMGKRIDADGLVLAKIVSEHDYTRRDDGLFHGKTVCYCEKP